jgi:IS30 family transposase
MANILTVHEQQTIARLAAQGWSIRRIARELKIHRKTVRQYLPEAKAAPKCTTTSTAGLPSKCTISTAGKMGRKSLCDAFAKLIEEKTVQGLSAQRIYQDLKIEVQFTGSYESVKRFVRVLRQTDPERVWRIEVAPGEEVQVDFGTGASIVSSDGGRKRRGSSVSF